MSGLGYHCVVCGRWLPAQELDDGTHLVVHDDVAHPDSMTFDEEENPQ